MINTRHTKLFAITLFSLLIVVNSEAQVDYHTLSEQLLGEDLEERALALETANNIINELHSSLIVALEREAEAQKQRNEAELSGGNVDPPEDPEFVARLTTAVVGLRDPRTIPTLIVFLGTGSTATPMALAAFGELAAPTVTSVVTSTQSTFWQVDHGLISLRCMVEDLNIRPLLPSTIEEIRSTAEHYLSNPGLLPSTGIILRRAIDLAVKMNDSKLREIVKTFASDENEITLMGIVDEQLIKQTQQHAADRLAGKQPLPLCN